ncbi:MAG: hypothetical protein Q4F98_07930 [Lachnospiraceae bacterium]|nr:hypothetical protein [Lachnospiraceae bacterium]
MTLIERFLIFIVLRKDEMDIQVFQTALKEYMSGQKKNIHRLMFYAKVLGIERKIREYTG